MYSFSQKYRPQILEKLNQDLFDIVVIGGGITGAGIALDAISRGLKVALIEKSDFASGTSSKSTKLFHGGLRYLKDFEFSLVKESGRERAIVYKLAPHLIRPTKMLFPLPQKHSLPLSFLSFGLWLYDFLASVQKKEKKKMLSSQEIKNFSPLLSDLGVSLKGAGYYTEYLANDARLTINILRKAHEMGAVILNYTEALSFDYKDKKISSLTFKDHLSGNEYQISGKFFINASGPWCDDICQLENKELPSKLLLTKGVHLVLPREKLPLELPVYFENTDGRMIFMIPKENITYIGTTDTFYSESKENIQTIENDKDYLLNAVHYFFPKLNLSKQDIISQWAGLRPLVKQDKKKAGEISRKDEIFESETGLISIAGGKLTGYRIMAKKVIDLVIKKLNLLNHPCQTANLSIVKNPFKTENEFFDYQEKLIKEIQLLKGTKEDAISLLLRYGKEVEGIIEKIKKEPESHFEDALLKAELEFTYQNEMIIFPEDFFIRRTQDQFFNPRRVERVFDFVQEWLDIKLEKE